MERFTALRIHEHGAALEELTLDDLSPGDVTIRVHWSGINYKDALAGTGKGRILRRFPLVGGVDLAGVVVHSDAAGIHEGERVVVTGCGLSETRDGGYAGYARVPAEAVVPLPSALTLRDAMIIGTAGFAAALAVTQLEHNGLVPGGGPVAVTGAGGGVGLLAIDMLARRGHQVVALTRTSASSELLHAVGAQEVEVLPTQASKEAGTPAAIDVSALGSRPLEPERWAGAIDNVGGALLSRLLRSTRMHGSVASVGLAGGAELSVSLMPFLLRGVNLLGVNSAATPRARRLAIWQRLATDLAPRHLDRIATRTVTPGELPQAFESLITGRNAGRTLVRIHDDGK
ncbi:MAG TPA: acryloyl-CoA reductase [Steroidobacteraceae bacterium]|nr:acryloyl-CoA reductase [Steroidobacteraceae bacterium]